MQLKLKNIELFSIYTKIKRNIELKVYLHCKRWSKYWSVWIQCRNNLFTLWSWYKYVTIKFKKCSNLLNFQTQLEKINFRVHRMIESSKLIKFQTLLDPPYPAKSKHITPSPQESPSHWLSCTGMSGYSTPLPLWIQVWAQALAYQMPLEQKHKRSWWRRIPDHDADDILLFPKANPKSLKAIKSILNSFSKFSELSINSQKSSMIFSKICENSNDLQQILNFPVSKLPITYLDVPITRKKKAYNQCWKLIQLIEAMLARWSGKCLSYGGRIQLVNWILAGKYTYWAQGIALPSLIGLTHGRGRTRS